MAPRHPLNIETWHGGFFEDIIDGYFPLSVSLSQMMVRRALDRAFVCISHAPIMHIPGLAPDAPVPLNIRSGRAGTIERLSLFVDMVGAEAALHGRGTWRWLTGNGALDLTPGTRLAEPLFLSGMWISPTTPRGPALEPPHASVLKLDLRAPMTARDMLHQIEWHSAWVFGAVSGAPGIGRDTASSASNKIDKIGPTSQKSLASGSYWLVDPADLSAAMRARYLPHWAIWD